MSARHDFEISQGSTFHKTVRYRPSNGGDFTGYGARLIANSGSVTVLNLTPGEGITCTPGVNELEVSIDIAATDTALLNFKKASYELKLYVGSWVSEPILKGTIKLDLQEDVNEVSP